MQGDMAGAQKSLQLLSGDNLMFIPLIQHLELIILVLLFMRMSGIVCGALGQLVLYTHVGGAARNRKRCSHGSGSLTLCFVITI